MTGRNDRGRLKRLWRSRLSPLPLFLLLVARQDQRSGRDWNLPDGSTPNESDASVGLGVDITDEITK